METVLNSQLTNPMRPTLGFRFESFKDATTVGEIRQAAFDQNLADRLNGLLDAYEPIVAQAITNDQAPRVDHNSKPGQVAVAGMEWSGRTGKWHDPSFDIYAGFSQDVIHTVDMAHGALTVLQHEGNRLELYSPQEDLHYHITINPKTGAAWVRSDEGV